jgi:hypothetical protein
MTPSGQLTTRAQQTLSCDPKQAGGINPARHLSNDARDHAERVESTLCRA